MHEQGAAQKEWFAGWREHRRVKRQQACQRAFPAQGNARSHTRHRKILAVTAVAACAIVGPVTATQASAAKTGVTQGVVLGGVTGVAAGALQGYPIVFELNKAGTRVRRATIVVDAACTVPPNVTGLGDEYNNVAIKRGTFKSSFGPERVPGTPARGSGPLEFSGSLSGRINKARTKITGTWSLKVVAYDPTGAAVTYTCNSGAIRYTAKN
jgi:hypothetical protein